MSQYSLQLLNAEKYLEEFEDIIIYNFENYLMQKRFRVGQGIETRFPDRIVGSHSILTYTKTTD